jgi:hypothetical protein
MGVDQKQEVTNEDISDFYNEETNEVTAPVNNDSVDTEEGEVSNETFVRATRSTSSGSVSAGTYVNIYDTASKDNRSEFNESGNGRFGPDKDGEYLIDVGYDIRGNTSSGDEIRVRVQNITDGSTVHRKFIESTGSASVSGCSFIVNLDSSKEYELQVTNQNSSFDVKNNIAIKGQIVWSVVQ